MKTRISFLFITMYILLMIYSFDAFCEEEILFRNIPWGTSASEIEKLDIMGTSDFYDGKMPYVESMQTIPRYRSVSGGTDFVAGFKATCYVWRQQLKVGGYEVDNINFYCAYSLDGNNLLKDKEHSRLYAADYEFSPLDYASAYSTLSQKLTDIYGMGTVTSGVEQSWMTENGHSTPYDVEYSITVWDGANDTHIVLVGSWINDEDKYLDYSSYLRNFSKTLFMTYYRGDLDEELMQISKIEQQLEIQAEKEAVAGYDGL